MAPKRGFEPQEFQDRTTRAQVQMAAMGIDLMLLTTEPDVRYFSGFLSQFWQSPTRPWFLLVPSEGKPVAVVPTIGEEPFRRTWLDDIRTWASPNPEDEGISLLLDAIAELVGEGPVIGVPMGPESHLRMPLSDFDRVKAAMPGATFTDCAPVIRSLRMIKSAAEIEKISHTCAIGSRAFAEIAEQLSIGMTDIEVFRTFKQVALGAGADDVSYLVGGAGQGGYGDIISPPSGRALRGGDVLVLDTGLTFDGYFCDFDRNYGFGDIGDAARDAHARLHDATEAGLAAVRPGQRCSDVFRAMARQFPPTNGGVGRIGHGLGSQLTEWPSISAGDHTEISEGMVLTLEPSMEISPGRMLVHEENIVVTVNGARLLTERASREMPIIG